MRFDLREGDLTLLFDCDGTLVDTAKLSAVWESP